MLENYKYLIPEESNGVIIENVKELRRIETVLRDIFNKHCLNEILIPLFEYVELYKSVYKDFDEEKIFKYIGKDGKVIALRWDFTIPIARYYLSQNTQQEAKYSYFGKVYRKEKTYKGRSTESYQAGIELINKKSKEGDIECLNILQETMDELKLSNLKLELGSAKFFNRLCELVGDKEKLVEILSKKNISAMEAFVLEHNELSDNVKKILLKIPRLCGNIDMLNSVIQIAEDEIMIETLMELKMIYEKLEKKEDVIFDLSMCPTMEYYTGLMFKVYSPHSPEPIVSGGRYDSLYKNLGKDVPAIGMGYYINNILKVIEEGENEND